ncbi:MAG: zeta toxin family protein [Methanomassiliicoccaceae archaeon]|nr:zeta toxin family protein [Methanomassiliicoccaceae archaeon]
MPAPRLLIIAGPNGSGKSSIVTSTGISKDYGENIINPDNYARSLTDIEDETERYLFALIQCEALRRGLLKNKVSFGLETLASTQEKIDFVTEAKTNGYEIHLVFVSLENAELCCRRVQKRVEKGGHDVEHSKIFSRYDRAMNYLKEYIALADMAYVFDNSGKMPALVFSKNGNRMSILKRPSDVPWVEKYIFSHYSDADKVL